MKITSITAILLVLGLQGCATNGNSNSATQPNDSAKTQDSRACMANFSTEGNFWTGRQFKTFEDFPKKSQAGVFDSLVPAVSSGGYQILNANKDIGLISAANPVSYSRGGQSVPINLSVRKNTPSGVRVEIVFSVTGGIALSLDELQKEFCRLLTAASQSPDEVTRPPATTSTPQTKTQSPASKPAKSSATVKSSAKSSKASGTSNATN